jgi:hypothetical protein
MRIMVGVGGLVQRTRDNRTGLHRAQGDKECRFFG